MDVFERIDGKGYSRYKELRGKIFRKDGMEIVVTRVQPDPFAPPSTVRISLPLPFEVRNVIPVADTVHRALWRNRPGKVVSGEGKSGVIDIPRPSPIVVPRSAVEVKKRLVIRTWVGLPSRRRRILGEEARRLLLHFLPLWVRRTLSSLNEGDIRRAEELWRDQEYVRRWLEEKGYTFFVGDGSILPRRCGNCWEPLEEAVPFESPKRYREEIELPSGRMLEGMVGKGVLVITGPAFHGKSTLLKAIAESVWNHVEGDGREWVITRRESFYVRSENGRRISCVDLRAFLHSLPGKQNISCFSSESASGSTSAAASIQEMVEIGVSHILLDEDETASNFLQRDFISEEITGKRTVIPLPDTLEGSPFSVTVASTGSLPFLARATRTVIMDEYLPKEGERATERARQLLRDYELSRYVSPYRRVIGKVEDLGKVRLRGYNVETRAGTISVHNPQLVEGHQYSTALRYALLLRKRGTSVEQVKRVVRDLWKWRYPFPEPGPDIVAVRPCDVWFVLNRLPLTYFSQKRGSERERS